MKPTQEQIKEFWERYGFEQLPWGKKDYHYEMTVKTMNWIHPLYEYGSLEFLPRIDLNNLFKYAVPRLQDKGHWVSLIGLEHMGFRDGITNVIIDRGSTLCPLPTTMEDKDPALALFWALWQVRKEIL